MSHWLSAPPAWAPVAGSALGTLLVVGLGALSAPVTANRLRLWQLDRLLAVLDRMDPDDPSQPYVAAEARKRSAWWTATTMVRLSRGDIGYLIFSLWICVLSVKALIFPNPVLDWPYIWWWAKAWVILGAVLEVSHRLGRRRWERVRVYNTLLSSGPAEFSTMLRKRPLVPRWYRGTINARLDDEGVTTCPSGHPVAGSLVRIAPDPQLIGKLVCARCGATLPRPPAIDVDEVMASVKSKLEHQRKKKEKRARRAATPTGGPSS
jgi:hypothetical protein